MNDLKEHKCRWMLIILLFVPVVAAFAAAIPEATITRSHLMKDIVESHTTVGVGTEFPFREDPSYVSDLYYVYYGYAPYDWLEIDLTLHSCFAAPYPAVEAKIDIIDIFTDSGRLSTIVMGGIGFALAEDIAALVYHGGGAVNYRLSQYWQLYLGMGSDSISKAFNLQAGAYFATRKWFGISMGFSLVTGSAGIELTPSLALLATFRRDQSNTN